jgi:peptidoglycan/LPS O-acetylase OafA/YrhL
MARAPTQDRPNESADAAMQYMPQLDGLRTLAVAAVVLQHYAVLQGGAAFGVHLFFVLSGFLITRILLTERENVSTMGITRGEAFRHFYVRRTLRIFPLYYLVLFIGMAVNAQHAREYAPWLLSYTINLKMAAQGWYIANFAHFWSLAVEEQYYLIWPWLILLLPRRSLVTAAIITTLIGPLFRVGLLVGWRLEAITANGLWAYIGTPAALDSLGIGSLISILMDSPVTADKLRRWMRWRVPVVAAIVLLPFLLTSYGLTRYALIDAPTAVFFGWLVYTASRGFSGLTGRILSASPMVFVGRISYGVYVYHPFIPTVVTKIAPHLGISLPSAEWKMASIYIFLTLALATISFYSFERPINKLKRKFPYVNSSRAQSP